MFLCVFFFFHSFHSLVSVSVVIVVGIFTIRNSTVWYLTHAHTFCIFWFIFQFFFSSWKHYKRYTTNSMIHTAYKSNEKKENETHPIKWKILGKNLKHCVHFVLHKNYIILHEMHMVMKFKNNGVQDFYYTVKVMVWTLKAEDKLKELSYWSIEEKMTLYFLYGCGYSWKLISL